MSQCSQHRSPGQVIDVLIDQGPDLSLAVDGHCYPPQPAKDQASQRLSHFSDTSIPLFTLYQRIAEEHDGRRRELLRADADQILVFCGLFSATIAALVVPWLSALPPGSTTSFSKQSKALINANMLWLYSLLLNISCALTALSLQQWVRPQVTLSHYSLPEQVRLAALFAARIEKSKTVVKLLHFLIFTSLIDFFVGLLLFFSAINRTAFYFALAWTIIFITLYAAEKSMVYLPGSFSSYTPFTQTKAEKQSSHTDGDGDILKRTLDMLGSDDDLEQFLETIPGFCASKIVDDPRRSLDILGRQRLTEALVAFWNRTLSANRASESVKGRRLVICMRVIEAAELYIAVPQILHLLSGDLGEISRSVEFGHSLRPLRNGNAASLSRGIIAGVISNAEHIDRWFTLAMGELGISGGVLRDYLAHGDSVFLANLIHITRYFFRGLLQPHPDLTREALSILPSVSKFDIFNTLPELQCDFCDLWNEVVQQARSSKADDNPFIDILVEIRRLYVDLHGTSTTGHDGLFHQPASYPLCIMPDHHPESTTHTQEASGSTTGGASQTITTASPIPSPGDVLDVSHHTATSMPVGISQGIADTCIPSMAEPITQSPSRTNGDQPPDEGITRQEISSSTATNALLPLNPQVSTISAPDNSSGTGIPSATTRRENDNGQELDSTILTELTLPPN